MAKKKMNEAQGPLEVYFVRAHLYHDGDAYLIGEEIELTIEEAKPLLSAGVVEKKAVEEKKLTPETKVTAPKKGGAKAEGTESKPLDNAAADGAAVTRE